MVNSDRRPATLGVCAVFRDEAPYLREWIEFHRLMGVQRFFLYDNDSTDDWWTVLRPYHDADIVQIVHWPGDARQLPAYHHALRAWGSMVKWLAFLDIDEFLFSPLGVPIGTVLGDYPNVGAIGACWAVYGTGGIVMPCGLVTECFQRRSADDTLHRHVKSIVRTARTLDRAPLDPHHFFVDGDSVDVHRRTLNGPLAQSPIHEILRVNHYVSKSRQEATRKMSRPRADTGELRTIDLLDPALNAVHDPAIIPWVATLKAQLWRGAIAS